MENTKKLTKRDYFKALLEIEEVAVNEGLVKFINHELDLLDKKSERKQTAGQKENEEIKTRIIAKLVDLGRGVTVSELQKEGFEEYSNQKLSALLTQLVDNKTVTRTTDKKKAYFSIEEN